MPRFPVLASSLSLLLVCGCFEWPAQNSKPRTGALGVTAQGVDDLAKPAQEQEPAEKPKQQKVFGKTTQDIGKADDDPNAVTSDSKIRAKDPVTAPLYAYGPIMEQISKLGIDQAVNFFYAEEGRYPKDYDEFMQRIIKANNIQLPVLPFNGKYVYNEQTHKLEIKRSAEDAAKADGSR